MQKNKKKQIVNKNNVEYIFSEQHYNVIRVTVKRWTYDNAHRHVTAFRQSAKQLIVGHMTNQVDGCL